VVSDSSRESTPDASETRVISSSFPCSPGDRCRSSPSWTSRSSDDDAYWELRERVGPPPYLVASPTSVASSETLPIHRPMGHDCVLPARAPCSPVHDAMSAMLLSPSQQPLQAPRPQVRSPCESPCSPVHDATSRCSSRRRSHLSRSTMGASLPDAQRPRHERGLGSTERRA
jgi:hypothetical protein